MTSSDSFKNFRSDLVPDFLPFLFSTSDLLTLNKRSHLFASTDRQPIDEHANIWRCQHLQPTICLVCPRRVCEWRTAGIRAGDGGWRQFLSFTRKPCYSQDNEHVLLCLTSSGKPVKKGIFISWRDKFQCLAVRKAWPLNEKRQCVIK